MFISFFLLFWSHLGYLGHESAGEALLRSPREVALACDCSETDFIPRPICKDGGFNMLDPPPPSGCPFDPALRPPLGCPHCFGLTPFWAAKSIHIWISLFQHFTISPYHHFTYLQFHHFTISPFHHITISPFHHFAISQLYCSTLEDPLCHT